MHIRCDQFMSFNRESHVSMFCIFLLRADKLHGKPPKWPFYEIHDPGGSWVGFDKDQDPWLDWKSSLECELKARFAADK